MTHDRSEPSAENMDRLFRRIQKTIGKHIEQDDTAVQEALAALGEGMLLCLESVPAQHREAEFEHFKEGLTQSFDTRDEERSKGPHLTCLDGGKA